MTNSPIFEQQLALNTYWQQMGGATMLPGTNRAADRFAVHFERLLWGFMSTAHSRPGADTRDFPHASGLNGTVC